MQAVVVPHSRPEGSLSRYDVILRARDCCPATILRARPETGFRKVSQRRGINAPVKGSPPEHERVPRQPVRAKQIGGQSIEVGRAKL